MWQRGSWGKWMGLLKRPVNTKNYIIYTWPSSQLLLLVSDFHWQRPCCHLCPAFDPVLGFLLLLWNTILITKVIVLYKLLPLWTSALHMMYIDILDQLFSRHESKLLFSIMFTIMSFWPEKKYNLVTFKNKKIRNIACLFEPWLSPTECFGLSLCFKACQNFHYILK